MSRNSEIQEGPSISDIVRGMFRRKMLLAVPPLLGLIGGELFLLANKPRYIAEAQVIIENQNTPFDKTTAAQDPSGTLLVNSQFVASQVAAMRSDDIATRVVEQLNLDSNPEYNSRMRPLGTISKLAIALGFKDDPARYAPKALATRNLVSGLTIFPIPESNVISVKSTAGEASVAAVAANAIVETYVQSTREVSANGTDRARDWLAKQIEALRAKVSESEQAVEKYRSEAGLIRGSSSTLSAQQITELNTQIGVASNARIEAQAKVDAVQKMLKAKGDAFSAAELLASPSLQRLKDEQVAAAREITAVSAVYLSGHPKMIAAQRHLDAVNGQIRVEAQRIVESLQAQVQAADERATSLRNELERLKTRQAEANVSDVRLQALQRDAAANRTLLQSMLSRYADANARQDTSLQPGFARIIQRATTPAVPYFPKVGPTLMLAGIAGLLLGLGLAFVFEILAQPPLVSNPAPGRRRASDEEVEEKASRTVVVPDIAPAPSRIRPAAANAEAAAKAEVAATKSVETTEKEANKPASAVAARDSAATHLDQHGAGDQVTKFAKMMLAMAQDKDAKIFAVASMGSDAADAAVASVALGRALASSAKRVMLIDLAPPAASAEKLIGLTEGLGLADLVAGKADFTKSVTRDPKSKLHLVRYGTLAAGATEAGIVNRMPAIITALRTVYDITIINIGEARVSVVPTLCNADLTMMLAAPTRKAEAAQANKALEEAGAKQTMVLPLQLNSAEAQGAKASA